MMLATLGLLAVASVAPPPGPGSLVEAERAINEGQPARARVVAQQVLRADPNDAAALYWLGRAAFHEDRFDEAIEHLERATQLDDRNSAYFEWYGNALGREAQQANKLRQAFLARRMRPAWERAIELDPGNLGARESLLEFYWQAPGFMGGSKDKAFAQAEEIRRRDGLRGAMLLGSLFERDEQYAKAMEVFEGASRSHPESRLVLYSIGRISAVSGLRPERGVAALTAYVDGPAAPGEPSVAHALWRMGMIREKQGQRDLARATYQRALQQDPENKQAAEALKKLK
jgi:tetratricopeptide (TPR) repeat protein